MLLNKVNKSVVTSTAMYNDAYTKANATFFAEKQENIGTNKILILQVYGVAFQHDINSQNQQGTDANIIPAYFN